MCAVAFFPANGVLVSGFSADQQVMRSNLLEQNATQPEVGVFVSF